MYAALKDRLPNHNILCDPRITVENQKCYVPDIVILRGHTVAAIVEIKFVPHGYPVYEDDLCKLKALAEYQQGFQLLLDPNSGKFTRGYIRISADCILAFAAIGRHDASAIDPVGLKALMGQFGERFLPLTLGV